MPNYRELIRQNITFATNQGILTPQDLWQLKIEKLRGIFKELYVKVKESEKEDVMFSEVGLLSASPAISNREQEVLTLKFEVVKDILQTKINDREQVKTQKENDLKIQQLTTLLNQKENEELAGKTPTELREMIQNLKGVE